MTNKERAIEWCNRWSQGLQSSNCVIREHIWLLRGPSTKSCYWDSCQQREWEGERQTEDTVILASPEKSPCYWGLFVQNCGTYCDSFEWEIIVCSRLWCKLPFFLNPLDTRTCRCFASSLLKLKLLNLSVSIFIVVNGQSLVWTEQWSNFESFIKCMKFKCEMQCVLRPLFNNAPACHTTSGTFPVYCQNHASDVIFC